MLEPKLKNKASHRARIIEGQMRGITKGIEEEKYCVDLLNQVRAIQNSLKSLSRLILQNHIKSRVKNVLSKKAEGEKMVTELVNLLELSDKYN